jgi:hypothetical protein
MKCRKKIVHAEFTCGQVFRTPYQYKAILYPFQRLTYGYLALSSAGNVYSADEHGS